MLPYEILAKKRDGRALSRGDIARVVEGAARGTWDDAQLGAFLMAMAVHGAGVEETRALTEEMLDSGERWDLAAEFPRLSVLWADRKYRNNDLDAWLAGQDRLRVEVTSTPDGQKGFHPPPKRWVVEQTFAGLIRSRRLVRDFERLPETSAAMVKLSSIHRMARRARPPRGRRKFRYKPEVAA